MPNIKPPAPSDRRYGVHVYGARELRKQLRIVYSVDLKDISKIHREVGKEKVLPIARITTPVKTGRLKDSLRITATQRYGELRAGWNTSVPYAGVVEYGGYNNIKPREYGRRAVTFAAPQALRAYEEKLKRLFRSRGIRFEQ
jgi:hypothetical protein